MLAELLRLGVVLLLMLVLPGYVAVQAAFPPGRSRLTMLERGYLTVVGGIVLLILVGLALGFLPHSAGRGFFQTSATGMPNVELLLLAVTGALFFVGLQRGAWPGIAKRFPRLVNPDGRVRNDRRRPAQ